MKVYISSYSLEAARDLAKAVAEAGNEVVSTWHSADEKPADDSGWRELIAKRNDPEIRSCDLLILISQPQLVPGGMFVEAGIAIGAGKKVIVMGERGNRLLWHPSVQVVSSKARILASLMFLNNR